MNTTPFSFFFPRCRSVAQNIGQLPRFVAVPVAMLVTIKITRMGLLLLLVPALFTVIGKYLPFVVVVVVVL